jgi:WD40 repeat protein
VSAPASINPAATATPTAATAMATVAENTCYLSKLKGHKKAVNCLDVSVHEEYLVASGSDDRSLRLWDIRSGKSVRCALGFFSGPVETVCFDQVDSHLLYASSGRDLFSLDLRAENVLVSTPSCSWPSLTADDITAVRSSASGKVLAVGDDNGTLTMLASTHVCSPIRTVPALHKSILSSLSFRNPGYDEIVCGGFDCTVSVWNLFEDRARTSVNMADPAAMLGKTGASAPQQFFNPAFVHGVEYLCDGDLIACAVGDGSVS